MDLNILDRLAVDDCLDLDINGRYSLDNFSIFSRIPSGIGAYRNIIFYHNAIRPNREWSQK